MGMQYSWRPSLNARKELREPSEADDPSVDDAVVDFDCRCECVLMVSAPCVSCRRLVLRCSYDLSGDDLRAAANGLQKSVWCSLSVAARAASPWSHCPSKSRRRHLHKFVGMVACYVPSNSPMALRSSTGSHTALTITRIGTPNNRPATPHSQPKASTPTNTATGFIRLARLVSQGVSK